MLLNNPLAVVTGRLELLRRHLVRHLTGHPAERLGEVRLRGENARNAMSVVAPSMSAAQRERADLDQAVLAERAMGRPGQVL